MTSQYKPTVLSLVACDAVYQEPSGKLALIGIFNGIQSARFPLQYDRISIYVSITNCLPGMVFKLRIVQSGTKDLVTDAQTISAIEGGMSPQVLNLTFECERLVFEKPSSYTFEIWGNGHLLMERPFAVVQASSSKQPHSTNNDACTDAMLQPTPVESESGGIVEVRNQHSHESKLKNLASTNNNMSDDNEMEPTQLCRRQEAFQYQEEDDIDGDDDEYDEEWPINVPEHAVKIVDRWRWAYEELENLLNRQPTLREMLQYTRLSVRQIRIMLHACKALRASIQTYDKNGKIDPLELFADTTMSTPEIVLQESEQAERRKQAIQSMLHLISEREATILRLCYGLDDSEPMALKQIGMKLGLTAERVRQLKKEALRKLRGILDELPIEDSDPNIVT
jgi:DNA-binding CsgD family transcriptional regulator